MWRDGKDTIRLVPFSTFRLLWDISVGNNIRLKEAGCEIKGHITEMISIDLQPWEHRGGPAFVTSKLNPIADLQRTLINWPCSPSLINWWRVLFQVDHHYVSCIHWFFFSQKDPLSDTHFLALLFLAFFRHLGTTWQEHHFRLHLSNSSLRNVWSQSTLNYFQNWVSSIKSSWHIFIMENTNILDKSYAEILYYIQTAFREGLILKSVHFMRYCILPTGRLD